MKDEVKVDVVESDNDDTAVVEATQEIDKAIDDMVAAKNEDMANEDDSKSDTEVSDTSSEKENLEVDDSNQSEKEDSVGDDVPTVTDAQIERAIKAGMSMADARKITDPALLDRFTEMLESKSSGKADEQEESETGAASDDSEIDIPDLDPEEFDETLVQGWSAMKALIKQQSELIKNMSQGNKASWFDSKVDSLGFDVGSKKDALKTKYDVLAAGYKAANVEVSEGDVFEEAARLVLGDELNAAKEKSDKADLSRRNKLLINRPTSAKATPHKDPLDEVAEEIDRKFFGKK